MMECSIQMYCLLASAYFYLFDLLLSLHLGLATALLESLNLIL